MTPLRAVLDALAAGAATRPALVAATGLPRDVVDAAVGHLVLTGRLEPLPLTAGCPAVGCGTCAVASACGSRRA